ncbi:recombinase zinc beta ribbon domain-containing protein [Patescibacteria group bacterium]|nr:recombinase zinc beta ribbon domain-containing protein [Patescibacteria group bacterium]MBU4580646.1 recombinase zinc beta ribbon domain-containing protein [Patescibacteria group bacterium]
MRIKGKLYPNKYTPLIPKELFDKVQEVRIGYHKKPFKYASKPYILRGLIKCANPACGCTITAENPKGYVYYSCTNYHNIHDKRTYISEKDLLAPIREVLKDLKLKNKDAEKLTTELRKVNQSENAFHIEAMENLKKEYDKIEKRLNAMVDLRIDGSITSDMYDKKLKEYKEQQQELLEEMQRHSIADESYFVAVNQVISLSQRASEIFESSEPNEKRQLLNYLLQNCRLNEKRLLFEMKKPFNALVEYNKCPEMLRRQDSNLRPRD